MGRKIDKAKSIVKAFVNPLPKGEDWFERRLEICNSCEYNSKNMEKAKLMAEDHIKDMLLCPEKTHCTACGCCIPQKPSQKDQTCGLIEAGLQPKWFPIEVKTPKDSNLKAENLTDEVGSLQTFGTEIIYDLGEVSAPKVEFSLLLTRKGGFNIKSVDAGCSCTVASPEKLSENSYRFNIALSTKKFSKGAATMRSFKIEYYTTPSRTVTIPVKIKAKKL